MSSTDEFGRTLMEGEAGAHVSSAAQSGQDRWKHDRMQAPPSVGSTEIVTLGGKVFEDAAALWNYTKALRDTLDRDATVDGKGKLILLDLLDRHPRAAAKKGVGVASLTFGEHPTFKGTQCFMINRTDGTQEDFSFRKCIQAIFPDSASRGGGKNRGNNSQHKRGREGGGKSSARDSNKKHKPSSMLVAGGEALTLVKVENLPLGVRWSDLKKEVEVYGKVNYVQRIERGSTSTVLQMSQSSDVGAVVASFQSMDGKELVVHALTKEEEDKYFQDHHQGGQGKSGAAVGVVKKE